MYKTKHIIIITLPTRRDCPVPGQMLALIGPTAGNQESKHRRDYPGGLLLLLLLLTGSEVLPFSKQMHQQRLLTSAF